MGAFNQVWRCHFCARNAKLARQIFPLGANEDVCGEHSSCITPARMQGWPGFTFAHIVMVGLALALLIAVLAALGFAGMAGTRWGRVALVVGLALLPVSLSAASLNLGFHESSKTTFCLSCHEMQIYGKSLFVDDRQSIPAVHYQNRLVDRETACYSCHTNYAMFGTFEAKLNGLHHVWVHYFGQIPAKPKLYAPYPNANCLHCHEDARRFIEAPPHQGVMASLQNGQTSCLSCHRTVHELDKAAAGQFWQAR